MFQKEAVKALETLHRSEWRSKNNQELTIKIIILTLLVVIVQKNKPEIETIKIKFLFLNKFEIIRKIKISKYYCE